MMRMVRSGLPVAGLLFAWLIAVPMGWAQAQEAAAAHPAATLTIHVLNVSAGGTVRLGLYDRAGYPDDHSKPIAAADVKAVAGETVIVLRDIPPGVYAIETYQDINDNDQMDTTWLGLPLEPYGFSRDVHPFLSKPSFSKVKFTLAAGEQSQTLHMQNGVSLIASK
ncbi:MAG TPA: DUF2141 domain-containing protein [Rhizomicrobium sp.]|nr:DUF2141 domain-containing protein [Rhizomicrobium sp.]